jgi:lipoprotein-releasing system permease protein
MERGVNAVNRFFFALSNPNVGAGPEAVHLLDPAYYLEKIPVHLRMDELFLVAAGTLVLSVLVSLLPAIRAGREKPIDTLRKV